LPAIAGITAAARVRNATVIRAMKPRLDAALRAGSI
jgi:hypothetical protein